MTQNREEQNKAEKRTVPESFVTAKEGQLSTNNHNIIIAESKRKDNSCRIHSLTMNELFDQTFPPRPAVIDELLYSGTYILVGSPKIGKSFLMAQIGYHVAAGLPLWDYQTRQGGVLYLALEDDYGRLQRRLAMMFGEEGIDRLNLAIEATTLERGLVQHLEEYCRKNEGTKLIIIDTLQRIRDTENEKYSYGKDYEVITKLKEFSDIHKVCILIVHHTRKMDSSDSFEMISGTNGLLGAADGAFVLKKKERTDSEATLEITGRDQPDQKLTLEFDQDRCIWKLLQAERGLHRHKEDPLLKHLAVITGEGGWEGSPTELLEKYEEAFPGRFKSAVALSKYLNPRVTEMLQDFGILYSSSREHTGRKIRISYNPEEFFRSHKEDKE